MDLLDDIKKPLEEDFRQYEEFMKRVLRSDSHYVSEIMDYIVSSRGKGIRPMLVFLCAGMYNKYETLGKRAYLAAMLIEMVHNASLIHDDVVDDADTRHGKPTVNSRWSSKVSVLSGDYILARSFSLGMQSAQFDIVAYIINGIAELAEGELIQNEMNAKHESSREKYIEVIFKKTAILLGVSCGAGAMASGASQTEIGIARQIGLSLGMAFQIKDDILDFAPEKQTGKPFCADLREGKITLPLIAILEKSDATQQRLILCKIQEAAHKPELVDELADFVQKQGGIEAATEVMHEYLDTARAIINSCPQSAHRTSLLRLCDYVGARTR